MRRPTNIAIIAAVMFAGAAVAALAALAFFAVALLVATGDKSGDPISVAIIGMGFSGGLALLILALLATSLRMGLPEFRDWARTVPAAEMLSALELRARNVLSSASRSWAAAFPSRAKNHKLSFRPSK
ncbi:MAG: hypothetical protein WA197_21695 [Candidatus Acidiferrales bacterium]